MATETKLTPKIGGRQGDELFAIWSDARKRLKEKTDDVENLRRQLSTAEDDCETWKKREATALDELKTCMDRL